MCRLVHVDGSDQPQFQCSMKLEENTIKTLSQILPFQSHLTDDGRNFRVADRWLLSVLGWMNQMHSRSSAAETGLGRHHVDFKDLLGSSDMSLVYNYFGKVVMPENFVAILRRRTQPLAVW